MDLEQLLESLRPAGGVDSSGRFLLDLPRARALLSQLRLSDPYAYVLHLVAAAVAFGAEAIEVECGRGQVSVSWDGPPLELGQLEELLGGWGERSRALGELSLGLAGALALGPRRLEVVSGGRRLGLTDARGGLNGTYEPTCRRSQVSLQRSPWRWRVPPEAQRVDSRCRLCPVPLRLNGRAITQRPTSLKPALVWLQGPLNVPVNWHAPVELRLDAVGPFTAVLAPSTERSLLLVVDGLSYESRVSGSICFQGVVVASHLRRDLSGGLVQDEAYAELLAALPEACLSLALHGVRHGRPLGSRFLVQAAAGLRRAARLDEATEILAQEDPGQLATVLHRLGRLESSELPRVEDELLVKLEQGTAPPRAGLRLLAQRHPEVAALWVENLAERGWPEEAREQFERLPSKFLLGESATVTSALLDLREGRLSDARESAASHLHRRLAEYGQDHPEVAAAWNLEAAVLAAEGDFEGAGARVERARAGLERVLGPSHPDVAATLEWLGDLRSLGGADPSVSWEQALQLRSQPLDRAFLLEKLGRRGSGQRRRAWIDRALDLLRSCRADGWRRGAPVSYQGWFASSSHRLVRPLALLEPEAALLGRLLELRAGLESGGARHRWHQRWRAWLGLQELIIRPIPTGFAVRDCPAAAWVELESADGTVWRTDDPSHALVRVRSGGWVELWPRGLRPGSWHRLTLGLAGGYTWTSPELRSRAD